jgi:predicted RNA-binding Zn-ribbon protein involved in translation (DUF1610 family)
MLVDIYKENYSANYSCSNCDWFGKISFPMGTIATHTVKCPNCGNNTAHRPGPLGGLNNDLPGAPELPHRPFWSMKF